MRKLQSLPLYLRRGCRVARRPPPSYSAREAGPERVHQDLKRQVSRRMFKRALVLPLHEAQLVIGSVAGVHGLFD